MGGGAYGRHIVPRRAADVLGGASGVTTGTGAAGQTALGRPERLTLKAGCSTSITMEVCDESAEVGVDWDLAGAHPARQRRRGAGRPGVLPPGKGRLKAPGSDIVPRRAAHLARRGTFASLRRTDQEEALGKTTGARSPSRRLRVSLAGAVIWTVVPAQAGIHPLLTMSRYGIRTPEPAGILRFPPPA